MVTTSQDLSLTLRLLDSVTAATAPPTGTLSASGGR